MGYILFAHVRTESCDDYYFTMFLKKEPTKEQFRWWLKEQDEFVEEDTCYAWVKEIKVVAISDFKKADWCYPLPDEDANPNIEEL